LENAYIKSSFCDYSQITKAALFAKTKIKQKQTTRAAPIRLWQYLSSQGHNPTEFGASPLF